MYVFFKSDGHLRPKNRPCKTTGAVRKYRTAPAETYPNARAIRPAGHPGNAPKAAQVRPECPGHCGGHPSRLFHHDLVHEQESLAAGARVPGRDRSGILRDHLQVTGRRFGKLHPVTPDAVGIPEEQLRQAARGAVCKINIDSDLRLAMTGTIRQFFNEHPDKFDPREYLKPARANIKELVRHKLVDVLGCAGKA